MQRKPEFGDLFFELLHVLKVLERCKFGIRLVFLRNKIIEQINGDSFHAGGAGLLRDYIVEVIEVEVFNQHILIRQGFRENLLKLWGLRVRLTRAYIFRLLDQGVHDLRLRDNVK